jgi:hypothetical protein
VKESSANGAGRDETTLLRKMMDLQLLREPFGIATVLEFALERLPTITSLPYVPPLPALHTLIGSVVKAIKVPPQEIPLIVGDIYFETPLTPDEIFDFYATQFPDWYAQRQQAAHWQNPQEQMLPLNNTKLFVFSQLNLVAPIVATIAITVVQQASGVADVSMRITPMISQDEIQAEVKSSAASQIWPVFKVLEGAQMVFAQASPGSSRVQDTIGFITKSNLSQLAAAYEERCREAGWQRVANNIAEGVAWGTWDFTVRLVTPWTVTYTLTQDPTDPTYYTLNALARNRAMPLSTSAA